MHALYVTNANPRFTGVSATIRNLLPVQQQQFDLTLVGQPLPDCSAPISFAEARRLTRTQPKDHPFPIWHVRRDPEMLRAIIMRDVMRIPMKIVFTSAAQRRHSAFPRWLISRMDAVIATTQEAASFVDNVAAVVPHGVDTSVFRPGPDRAASWAALGHGGQRGVATIGRIRPEKGTDIFVQAMIAALPAFPDTVALVIGRAAPKHQAFLDDLKQMVAAAGLSERILFVGELPPDLMAQTMQGLSLVCQFPRYEGYGLVPLEGMASGAPFVATDTGYYRHFSQGGKAGRIIDMADTAAAAKAVSDLLADQDALSAMSTDATRIAGAQFSIQYEAAGIAAVSEALWAKG